MNARPRALVTLAALLATTICSGVGHAQTKPSGNQGAPLPATLPAPPSVEDPMLGPVPRAAQEIGTWEQAIELLRGRSTDLRTAYDEVERAHGQMRTALAGMLPTVVANGTYTHLLVNSENGEALAIQAAGGVQAAGLTLYKTHQAEFNALAGSDTLNLNALGTLPIIAPEAWFAYGTSKAGVRAAELSYEDMKRTIAFRVAADLIAVMTAERVAELNRIGTRNALERLDLGKTKSRLGAATAVDVVRAQQDVENSRSALVQGDESLRQAREALGLALGIPEPVGVSRGLNLDGFVASALGMCKVADSIEKRADVAAARARLEVAKRSVTDVYYQLSPTLSATSSLTRYITFPSDPADGLPSSNWGISGVLTVPIWDGGARYGTLRQLRALEDEALQNLESVRRQVTIQVEQAQRAVTVAEDSQHVATNIRALAAENDRLTRLGYTTGQGSSLDLVTAAAALRAADITLALRQFDLVKARIAAIFAVSNCPL